jgi:hypothetical protein
MAAARVDLMKAIATSAVTWDDLDPIHDTWKKVTSGVERKFGVGERAVIAYSLHAQATAVICDQLTLKRAVEHLRGKVLSTFGLLGALVEAGSIPATLASTFEARYRATGLGAEASRAFVVALRHHGLRRQPLQSSA